MPEHNAVKCTDSLTSNPPAEISRNFSAPSIAPGLNQVVARYAVSITPAMEDLIDPANPDDPIAKQFLPDLQELEETDTELSDPIGDFRHSPVKGIVHRYPDRLLLSPLKICPVYCRFCFRREQVGHFAETTLSDKELETALDYIRTHKEVWEVILSGGDPLILSPRRLGRIVESLNEINHVKVIRIHTRVPVVSPERINEDLLAALTSSTALFVVLHSNHAKELTTAATKACARLIDNGFPMLSQSVLLKGINDDADTMETLLRTLVENRIKPYYLHHPDRARGTGHFRVSLQEGRQLAQDLRGRVSGLCQPEYILDIPGGAGKVPAGPEWIRPVAENDYLVTDYRGNQHRYRDKRPR